MIKKSKAHLAEMNESYAGHMLFALKMAWTMMSGAILVVIHALVPGILQRSGSRRIESLSSQLRARQGRRLNQK